MRRALCISGLFLCLAAALSPSASSQESKDLESVNQIAVGEFHACALTTSGNVYCWGGAYVNGQSEDTNLPNKVPGLPNAKWIATGALYSCAIDYMDRAWCWGLNLGDYAMSGRQFPDAPRVISGLPAVSRISAGHRHACAIAKADGAVWCWGINIQGALGDGTTTSRATPVRVVGLEGARDIATGESNSCAIILGGEVHCWGTDFPPKSGYIINSPTPVHMNGSKNAVKIVNGRNFACALMGSGSIVCFGSNIMNQLGDLAIGKTYSDATPKGVSTATDVGASSFGACAVQTDGQVTCWGVAPPLDPADFDGHDPKIIRGLESVTNIAVGYTNACALLQGGRVKCWGDNSSGQIGNGSDSDAVTIPADVIGLPGESPFAAALGRARLLQRAGSPAEALAETDAALQLQPDNADALMLRGKLLLEAKRYDESIEVYDRVLKRDPENPEALRNQAEAHTKKGDDTKALAQIDAAIKLDPSNAMLVVERGLIMRRRGDIPGAEMAFAEARRRDEEIAWRYHSIGFEHFLAENYDSAIEYFSIAILLDPKSADDYDYRAQAYEAKGQAALALQDRQQKDILQAEKYKFDALIKKADVHALNDEYGKAIESYTSALAINPNSASTYSYRGSAYENSGNYDAAIRDYTKSLTIDADDVYTLHRRGLTYTRAKKFDLAIADLTRTIALEPNDPSNYTARGDAFEKAGDYDAAIQDYTKAITISPRYTYGWYCRAMAYRSIKKFDLAIADLSQAIQVEPRDASHYRWRGVAYDEAGDYDKALADLTHSLALEPDAFTYARRGHIYDAIKKPKQAIAEYTEAIKIASDDSRAGYLFDRALTYDDLKDYNHAIEDLTLAIDLAPKAHLNHKWRGIIRGKIGDYDAGLQDLNRAIELAPDANTYFHRSRLNEDLGRFDLAVADASKAIELSPTVQYLRRRSIALQASGQFDLALMDCDKAIVADPKDSGGYLCRGDVNFAMNRLSDATKDFDKAVAVDPEYEGFYRSRAIVALFAGDSAGAIEDLQKALNLKPYDAYTALWLEIALRRGGAAGSDSDLLQKLDPKEWPAPVIELYLGRSTPETVAERARSANPRLQRDQLCEANFYAAEWLLLNGRRTEALPRMQFAADNCPTDFIERTPAMIELKALQAGG